MRPGGTRPHIALATRPFFCFNFAMRSCSLIQVLCVRGFTRLGTCFGLALFATSAAFAATASTNLESAMPDKVLRAGFASAVLSPNALIPLMGYGFREDKLQPGNDGVHDPLRVRVVVLRQGTNAPNAIVSLDTAVVNTKLAREFRLRVAKALATDSNQVIVCATHTHSAPCLSTNELPESLTNNAAVVEATRAYLEDVGRKVVETAARAAALVFPVRVSCREAALGLGYNRRVMTPGGLRNCWSPQEWPERQPGPMPDPTCTLMMLRQESGSASFLLWSLGVHPVVLGKTSKVVSADFPGRACQLIEEYVPDSQSLFLLGGAANVHPWVATQDRAAMIEPVARAAASFVALLAQATAQVNNPELRTAAKTVAVGKLELDIGVWRVGPVWIVAVPVELFGELAADIRQKLGGPVLLTTLSNGCAGYFPTRKAFEEGGYEIEGIQHKKRLSPGDCEKLADHVKELADSLR